MIIKEIKINNFMIHEESFLSLSPLTVLVGTNGSGKSSFFDALINFSMISRGSIKQAFSAYPYSFHSTLYRGAGNIGRIGFSCLITSSQGIDYKYEIEYAQTGGAIDYTIFNEKLSNNNQTLFDRSQANRHSFGNAIQLNNHTSILASLRSTIISGGQLPIDNDSLKEIVLNISKINKYRLEPTILMQPYKVPDDSQNINFIRLGYLGEDLSSLLYFLNSKDQPRYLKIKEKIKLIEPCFQDFEFSNVMPDRIAFSVRYSDRREAVPSVRLSSGFLTYTGLVALLLAPSKPSIIMLEEPENGLTPMATKYLYSLIREVTSNNEDKSQVILSSHSPFVICEAWNGEDRDFIHLVKVVDGKTKISKFSQVIKDTGVHLSKDKEGNRSHLSLKLADELMSGMW